MQLFEEPECDLNCESWSAPVHSQTLSQTLMRLERRGKASSVMPLGPHFVLFCFLAS